METAALLFGLALGAGLILFRFHKEPTWAAPLRFILAVVVVWGALMTWESTGRLARIKARAAAGDARAWDHDTGGGAAMMLIGWVPALAYTGILSGLRSGILRFRRHESTPA